MGVYVGLDVSLASVAICVIDEDGRVLWEGKAAGDPEAVRVTLEPWLGKIEQVGLEAGPTSEWMGGQLLAAGFQVACLETRHVKAALSAMVVKTDRNDARGIAQIVRAGWFKAVHVKSAGSQRHRTLTTARNFLVRSMAATEQAIRGLLRPFGLKVGAVTRRRFAGRVHELVADDLALAAIIQPLPRAHERLVAETAQLHRLVLQTVRADPICRRLMTMPGMGRSPH
jgi:transposase